MFVFDEGMKVNIEILQMLGAKHMATLLDPERFLQFDKRVLCLIALGIVHALWAHSLVFQRDIWIIANLP